MEQTAFESIIIGVNVFIFIMALTAGIMLMSNIIDMVNFANDQAIVGMNGSLAESIGVVTDRTYTGTQMLRYYREIIENNTQDELQVSKSQYEYVVKLSQLGVEKKIEEFVKINNVSNYLNDKFKLQYKGFENNKHKYIFILEE